MRNIELVKITLNIPRGFHDAILAEQDDTGAPMGEIVRRALKMYLPTRGRLILTDERAKYTTERKMDEATTD